MSHLDEKVLVVDRNVVEGNGSCPLIHSGFTPSILTYSHILKEDNHQYIERSLVETDETKKQLIPYVLVRNSSGKYLHYTRSTKGGEQRLHNKGSIGWGGHVREGEGGYLFGMLREIQEELHITVRSIHFVGLLNDDSNTVGRVHLGLVHIVQSLDDLCFPKEEDSLEVSWKSPEELTEEGTFNSLEMWSKIVALQLTTLSSWSNIR